MDADLLQVPFRLSHSSQMQFGQVDKQMWKHAKNMTYKARKTHPKLAYNYKSLQCHGSEVHLSRFGSCMTRSANKVLHARPSSHHENTEVLRNAAHSHGFLRTSSIMGNEVQSPGKAGKRKDQSFTDVCTMLLNSAGMLLRHGITCCCDVPSNKERRREAELNLRPPSQATNMFCKMLASFKPPWIPELERNMHLKKQASLKKTWENVPQALAKPVAWFSNLSITFSFLL